MESISISQPTIRIISGTGRHRTTSSRVLRMSRSTEWLGYTLLPDSPSDLRLVSHFVWVRSKGRGAVVYKTAPRLGNGRITVRYSERRKFSRSCTWLGERVLNLLITPLASDPLL